MDPRTCASALNKGLHAAMNHPHSTHAWKLGCAAVRSIRSAWRSALSEGLYRFALRCALGMMFLGAPAPALSATWADPAKTLKAVFEIDVTGFDPFAMRNSMHCSCRADGFRTTASAFDSTGK